MKKLIPLVLAVVLLAVGGCTYEVPTPSLPSTEEEAESDVNEVDVETASEGVAGGSLYFTPRSETMDYVVLAPAYFEFGTVSTGSVIDTWTEDGYLQVDRNRVNYARGDPLYLVVFNDSVNSYDYEIVYEAPIDALNWSEATQQAYEKAPPSVKDAVAFSETEVRLEGGEARMIPFSLVVPEGTEYPQLWEFRISVMRRDLASTTQVGGKIRVFVSMK